MKIILIRIAIIAGILAIIAGILLFLNFWSAKREKDAMMAQFTSQYQELAQKCLGTEMESCCLASVKNMQSARGEIIPKNGCTADYIQNSLRCIGSYSWCEKKPEKDDKPLVPENLNIYS